MNKIVQFPTMAGVFYVLRIKDNDYRIQFDEHVFDEVIYNSIVEAIEVFVNESEFFVYHPELGYPLDLFDLGVSDEISDWKPF